MQKLVKEINGYEDKMNEIDAKIEDLKKKIQDKQS